MKFCPKCGTLLRKEGNYLVCPNCGYKEKNTKDNKSLFKDEVKQKEAITVLGDEYVTFPIDKDVVCPKCGNKGAYFWSFQTRASDEPETKFYKCVKCGYTWRSYD